MGQKKRRQHHVWKYYLKTWTTKGRLHAMRAGRIFRSSPDNVANIRDFYRLQEMSPVDLDFVWRFAVEGSAPHLREVAAGWIEPFVAPFEMRRLYENSGHRNEDFEKQIDITLNNLEEDLHAKIEVLGRPHLDELRRGETSFMDDDEAFVHFCWFMASQQMRTPVMMNVSQGALAGFPGVNVHACWGLLRTIFSSNIGAGLNRRREKLKTTFLDAGSGMEFITGDQPVFNVRADGAQEPNELALFYPLSPKLAVVLDFDSDARAAERRTATDEEVRNLNRRLFNWSGGVVYGASAGALESAARPGEE